MRGRAVRLGFWWDRVAWDRVGRPRLEVDVGMGFLNVGLGAIGGSCVFSAPKVTVAAFVAMIGLQALRAGLNRLRERAVYG